MQFAQSLWIIAGFLFCIAFYLLMIGMERKRRQALQNFAAEKLLARLTHSVSRGKRSLKFTLLGAAMFCCFLALARPQYGHRWIDVQRKGIDILFALDTSASMMAEDIRPNRLERSKFAILDFVNQLDGDRVGLMPFAGTSFLMCPLTVDYGAFEQTLQAVDTNVIPRPGTNLAQAILNGDTILQNDANHKLLIIVTDGENLEGDALQAAKTAAQNGMTIFTVGVGTIEGELIPVSREKSKGFVKDPSGQFVVSRLDERSLTQIARQTGGLYAPLGNRGQGLETIYRQKLVLIPKEALAERRQKVAIDRFPWLLGLALIFLFFEFLIGGRRTNMSPFSLTAGKIRKRIGFLLLFFFVAASPQYSHASQGEKAYDQEDYAGALQLYEKMLEKDQDNAVLHYNYGSAAYKKNIYNEAIASFNQALRSPDLSLQEKAYFNLGNARYKKGLETLKDDPEKTIDFWQEALKSYGAALELEPANQRAQGNHALVAKKLEELQKQQKQQQQGDNEPQDNSGDNNNSENQGNDQVKNQPQKQENRGGNEKPGEQQKNQQQSGEQQRDETMTAEERNTARPGDMEKEQQQGEMNNKEIRQRQKGTMSREEALQLLEEMKNEEGALNFIPRTDKEPPQQTGRDW